MAQAEREAAGNRASSDGTARHSRRTVLRVAGAGALAVLGGSAAASSVRSVGARRQADIGISVFPRHETRTASPHTEISLRGVSEEQLGAIVVVGSQSGGFSGLLMPHGDGNGVSYVPDSRFEPGEVVTVRADIDLAPSDDGSLVFEVSQPSFLREATTDVVTDEPQVPPHAFRSRPDLQPPVMDVTHPASGTDEGYIFVGARVVGGQSGALVIDDTGEPVWFSPPPSHLDAHYDVRAQEYLGEPVVTFSEANVRGPNGWRRGHYVICNSAYERIAEFQIGNGFMGGDHHELLLTSRGTALVGTYHPVTWDLSPYGGLQGGTVVDNVIQELEIETGRVLFEWHSLDHIAIDESYFDVPTDVGSQFDYLHMNSIGEDANGDLIISARHTFALYKIDRATGDIAWRLNGKQSDFEMGEGTPFAYTHDARFLPDGQVSLFDNAAGRQQEDATTDSRGLVLELDEEAMTATLVQEYIHPTGILSISQANTQVLPNGNVFVGWGSAPVISEFNVDGDVIFNCRFPPGGTSYRAYRFPWVGQPTEPPVIAAEPGTGAAGVSVYASWNGATEVASWRVLAGASPTNLVEVAVAERTGFETVIEAATDAAYVAAEALDAGGNVIGASEAVQAGG